MAKPEERAEKLQKLVGKKIASIKIEDSAICITLDDNSQLEAGLAMSSWRYRGSNGFYFLTSLNEKDVYEVGPS